jgi:hypothetical protein
MSDGEASNTQLNREAVMIDKTRVVGDLLFATQIERAVYIGTSLRDQPRWLREHRGRWWYIKDLQREAAPPGPPLESEIDLGPVPAGPNSQTSSHGVRDNGGDEDDDVALVDTLAGDRSPPPEPTSLPTPLTTTVENGTTKAELLLPAKAVMSEAEGPKTETTPLAAMGRKRGRRRGRQVSPERMRIVLDSLRERPILSDAAAKAGIHRKTLEYWLKRSEAGDDGYDLEWRGETARFHEHYESAIGEGYDELVLRVVDIAMGGVIYKTEQSLVDRGLRGPDAYLRDANGIPVVETIRNPNGKMLRFLLELLRPKKWGKHRKIDVPQTGGVLVVGGIPHDIPNKVNNATAASVKARKWKVGWRMLQETEVWQSSGNHRRRLQVAKPSPLSGTEPHTSSGRSAATDGGTQPPSNMLF